MPSFRSVLRATRVRIFVPLLLVAVALIPQAGAAEKYGNSLDWVPADVAVYSSALNWKEQIEIVGNSKAWQKFRSIPSIAMAWQLAEGQINDPSGPASIPLQMMQLPENQQLLQMLGDMFSGEIVFYGGPKVIDCVELFQLVNAAQQQGNLDAVRLIQQGEADDTSDVQAHAILAAINEHKELLKTPDIVVAFKLVDPAAAQTQLKRLEVIARMGLAQSPIPDRFKREKVGESEFLTLKLDGSLVPWDEAPWEEAEEEEGEFDELRKTLSELKLVVALGVRENYLILSIDESTENLAKLGTGAVLADAKEFAPLAKFKDRKLVSLGYVSEKFAAKMGYSSGDIDQMVEQIGGVLDMAGVDDAKLKDRIAGDIEKFGDDLKKYIPKPGAAMGFNFLTPTGYEGYSYSWAENPGIESDKPLELTNHVGGNPVLALVSRSKPDPEAYDLLVKWGKVGFGYFEEYAVPQMGGDEREKFAQAMEIARPALASADKATRDYLLPALADGQGGLVLDAKISSKQWHKDMPASAQAMPMAELALIVGVSDAAKLKQAFGEYRKIADEVVNKIRAKDPSAIPADYKIPDPQSKTVAGGTTFTYAIPADAGLDPQIAPTAGVGEHVAVLASSPSQAERLLKETPVASNGLLSAVASKPTAVAVYFNWAALVEAATPWVEFAIRENAPGAQGAAAEEDPAQVADILSQVRTGLEILRCWRTSESVTTVEDGVTITHGVTTFKDVE